MMFYFQALYNFLLVTTKVHSIRFGLWAILCGLILVAFVSFLMVTFCSMYLRTSNAVRK